MSLEDRRRWERKHEAAREKPLPAPAELLHWLRPQAAGLLALDLACGRGRNTLALLDHGYRVVATDIAAAALHGLRSAAASRERALSLVQCDLERWCFAPRSFDLIVQCDYLDRALIAPIRDSTVPGGCVLIDTFMIASGRDDRFGPSNPLYRLQPGELERCFADWQILRTRRQQANESRAARAGILARKPHDRR